MAASRRPRSRQAELFPRPKRSVIEIAPTHRLVLITEETGDRDRGQPGQPVHALVARKFFFLSRQELWG